MLIKTSKWKFDTLLFLLMVSLCLNSNVHNHLVTMDVLFAGILSASTTQAQAQTKIAL